MNLPSLNFDPDNVTGKYVLNDDGDAVEERHLLTWAAWMETADRQVLLDRRGQTRISTVFLALDYGYARMLDSTAPPVLWETMVFGPTAVSRWQTRYSSKLDAIAGHMLACELVEHFGDPPRRVKKALKKYHAHWSVTRPGDQRRVRRWYQRIDAYTRARALKPPHF